MTYYLNDLGILCACGGDGEQIVRNLLLGDRSGLQRTSAFSPGREQYLGSVTVALPTLPASLALYDCRNNQLLLAALEQILPTAQRLIDHFGPRRIGVVLGTSTSGVGNTEVALTQKNRTGSLPESYHYKQHQLAGGADFMAEYLGLAGPRHSVSSACASSGNALLSARRLLELEICDAVIVGGVDSLCGLTVNGFAALESISTGRCKPFGRHRDGINIGEAAALFVLSKQPGPVVLRGAACTSDGYHFSAPDPAGGAVIHAMRQALAQAKLSPANVDYLNLHGTATPLNDAMESRAVFEVFGDTVWVSSSKGMTGHTLGAAAALELGFCWLLLTGQNAQGALIANINDDIIDPELPPLHWIKPGETLGQPIRVCQSNAFAFGGSNVSIVVAAA